ncbi:Crp/Fnr family transcriptional regulator [Listeria immobilis]|uniref:Crp/Fnr family transcriptional regulator n=1 Tax=Listeria immobilis TaxID=2713502 RepID=A0ABR6SWW7_9LIST|nr:Crp/Fnr family transcriptional regulator [Listeria immobilis]MBC1484281.1 Crp/Fnr family transcriptional regulator [Listeria immobilis]MBC1506885.1 Crp/Fnr family transcriptional regulator [Listeria immobilis]MBC1510097.1 Crp/Fnr family transcriptional regulator [Listeria immobilis]MBC1515590.1 Crp/Fnr family transcriptional regulator [Listeria immobilis]MBC6304587.1 Crp/Fnr family transcriptional regulator [Listeria immobilis]
MNTLEKRQHEILVNPLHFCKKSSDFAKHSMSIKLSKNELFDVDFVTDIYFVEIGIIMKGTQIDDNIGYNQLLKHGDMCNFSSFISPELKRGMGTKLLSPSTNVITAVDRDFFVFMVDKHVSSEVFMLYQSKKEIIMLQRRCLLNTLKVKDRVKHVIAAVGYEYGISNGTNIQIPSELSTTFLSKFMGITREYLCLTMSELKKEGYLLNTKIPIVINVEKLFNEIPYDSLIL